MARNVRILGAHTAVNSEARVLKVDICDYGHDGYHTILSCGHRPTSVPPRSCGPNAVGPLGGRWAPRSGSQYPSDS